MNRSEDTLAALLTPLAPGAIAVIKLIGNSANQILNVVCRTIKGDQPPVFSPDVPRLCRIIDRGEQLDEAIVIVSKSPLGIPIVEFNTHGGVRVVQRVLELLATHGVEIVPAWRVNDAALSDGKVEQQIDAHLINSKSIRLTEWLLSQRERLPAFLRDYERLDHVQRVDFEKRSQIARKLLEGIRIAIIGPPNAGKSTLANCLIGHDRVITSDIPGTTRDWVSETALIEGWPVTLTDTAGIRLTTCSIEQESIRRGGEQARQADLVLIVLDGARDHGELLVHVADCQRHLAPDQLFILVLNKSDLHWPDDDRLYGEIRISARDSIGISELEQRISKMLGLDQLKDELPTGVPEIVA